MEQLDSILDVLVKQFVASVKPLLESELTKKLNQLKEKDDKIR